MNMQMLWGSAFRQMTQSCFTHNCLACSHTCLAFHINKVGCSIGVKGTSMKTAFRTIATKTIQTLSKSMNNKLIGEDFVAGLENANLCWNGAGGLEIS